jgi:hypothetical protein
MSQENRERAAILKMSDGLHAAGQMLCNLAEEIQADLVAGPRQQPAPNVHGSTGQAGTPLASGEPVTSFESPEWENVEGKRGTYETRSDVNSPQYEAIYNAVMQSKNQRGFSKDGYFYWIMQDGKSVARKPLQR